MVLEGFGRVWEGLGGFGRGWEGLGGVGRGGEGWGGVGRAVCDPTTPQTPSNSAVSWNVDACSILPQPGGVFHCFFELFLYDLQDCWPRVFGRRPESV